MRRSFSLKQEFVYCAEQLVNGVPPRILSLYYSTQRKLCNTKKQFRYVDLGAI